MAKQKKTEKTAVNPKDWKHLWAERAVDAIFAHDYDARQKLLADLKEKMAENIKNLEKV